MKMVRCRICGEVYLGSETPSHCPFCGAHREYLVSSEEYPADINDVQLTETERADLETSIELERSNTRFYLGMAQHKEEPVLSSAYKRLSKIEAEHCELFCKLVNIDEPDDLSAPMEVSDDWCVNIAESVEREKRASSLYRQFAARSTNERIHEVFDAVSAVEADHIEFDGVASAYAGCD
ncbi:MAG: ferritin [Coriobacteriia bacterium]|nr:ferritin [Coriobacteriia bacterium]